MFEGQLLGIFIAPRESAPMRSVDSVEALANTGLAEDRYALAAGTFSKPRAARPDQQVTLIESEALAAARDDYGIDLPPAASRRNLLTAGVPLNHLVGREFFVGAVRLRGLELCEPCKHLEKLTQEGVVKALVHRGGLRAQIVAGGTLHVGDRIRPCNGTE